MSLKLLFLAALFLLALAVELSCGTFCDQGPPGRYCYKDLTGWYECVYDTKTKTMNQTKHDCPANTRCQCFYGPSCPSTIKDPCAKYELPPPFPAVFSAFYTETVTTCDNKQCTNVTIIGDMQQNATAGEQRHDIVGTTWNTRFIFPFRYIDFGDFIQFDAAWFEKNCSLTSRAAFPRFGVPPYFTCDKSMISVKMNNATLKGCIWQSGGHTKTEEVTIERWTLINLRDGRYIPYSHDIQQKPSSTSNITVYRDIRFASFFPDFLDPSQLTMPTFCFHKPPVIFSNEA